MRATLLFEFKIKIPKPGLRVAEQRKLHELSKWAGVGRLWTGSELMSLVGTDTGLSYNKQTMLQK